MKQEDYMEGFLLGKLPKEFAESEASLFAKKVMGALLYHAETYKKVRETGVVVCSDAQLRKVSSIGSKYLLPAIDELVSYGLVERNPGNTWKEGEKKKASEYKINLEGLLQPLCKKEQKTEEFLSKFSFLKTPSKPSADGKGSTYTYTYSNTYTDTYSNTTTNSDSCTNSNSDSSTDSETTSTNNSETISEVVSNEKPSCATPVKSKDKLSDSSLFLQFRKQIENPSYDKLIKDITDTNFKRMVINKFYNFIKKNDELFKNKTELNSVKSYLFKIIKDKNKTRQSQLFYENCIQLGKELFDRLDREFNNRESYGKITEGKNNQWSASDTTSSYVKPYGEIPNNALVIEEPCCVAVPISSQVII